MKYPIEVISLHHNFDVYDPQKKYRVYRLSVGSIVAAAKANITKTGLTVRHTGGYSCNGVPALNEATGKVHIDTEHKGQTHWIRFSEFCDLTGNPITEQLKKDIMGRKASHEASTLILGKESFMPMIITDAEVILRSKNKRAISDPKSNLVFIVKIKTWQEGRATKTAQYSPEHDALMWGSGNDKINAANIEEVLQFVRDKIESLSGTN